MNTRRHYIVFILGILAMVIAGCGKEEEQRKGILHTDLDPDSVIRTIARYYSVPNPFCGLIPAPDDSARDFSFDLDDDGTYDFNIHLWHFKQEITQYCGHCDLWHPKMMTVTPLTGDAMVSADTNTGSTEIRFYDSTMSVLPTDRWISSDAWALREDGCMIPYIGFSDTWLGLKVNDRLGWIHVARTNHNGLIISSYAINLSKGQPIRAGQKE